MIASGDATGGMLVKIEGALAALERGVIRVRIGNVAAISDATSGTSLFLRED
jgi:acetylglutamate kinase